MDIKNTQMAAHPQCDPLIQSCPAADDDGDVIGRSFDPALVTAFNALMVGISIRDWPPIEEKMGRLREIEAKLGKLTERCREARKARVRGK